VKELKILCLAVPLILFGCSVDTVIPFENSNFESDKASSSSSESGSHEKKEAHIITTNEDIYSPFFAYDSSGMDEVITETGISGKLVLVDSCLLLEQPDGLSIPVFPSEESQWDAVKKRMIVNGTIIPLGKTFKATGGMFENPNLSDFKKVGDPKCNKNGSFASIWKNPSVEE